MLVAARLNLGLADAAAVENLYRFERLRQGVREWPHARLFDLPPSSLRPEGDVLLAAGGNHGHFGRGKQNLAHAALCALAQRDPRAIEHEMGIVTETLMSVFAERARQRFILVGEAKLARLAHDRARMQFVEVGEGWPHPIGKELS